MTKVISLFADWHWMRWTRLIISAYLLWQGWLFKDNFVLLAGSIFMLQTITNTGCCAVGSCSVPNQKITDKKAEDADIDYTTIKP